MEKESREGVVFKGNNSPSSLQSKESNETEWVSATLTGPCGDTMSIDLKIENDQVVSSRFWGNGCFHSKACLRCAAQAAVGKSVEELPEISPEYIMDQLKHQLPLGEDHCAQLAHETLMHVVHNYLSAWSGMQKKLIHVRGSVSGALGGNSAPPYHKEKP